ncbi:hypothetical protein D3C87_1705780 [compost metagenome]
MRLEPHVRPDLPDHFAQMGVAVLLHQEGQRFRHVLEDERDQHHRGARGEEHRLPAVGLDELLAEQRGEDAADRVAAAHQRDHQAAHFLR